MAFQGKTKKVQQQFDSPEEMYLRGSLPRTAEAVSSLWIHQGDVLRAYAEKHQDTPDLALELPTGTGKTLPGLLIAEWVRRKAEGPVLYAAPTKQLGHQVLATAKNEGVPARLLVGQPPQLERGRRERRRGWRGDRDHDLQLDLQQQPKAAGAAPDRARRCPRR